jgi:predicted esterase
MKLLGHRILLNNPNLKEPTIELTSELLEEFKREQLKKLTKLTVYAVGDEVVKVKEGQEVYVQTMYLTNPEWVEVDGEHKIMVREMDIALIW